MSGIRLGRAARIPAAALWWTLALVAACDSDSPAGGRSTTPVARRFDPVPLRGGCGEGDPVKSVDMNRDGRFDVFVFDEAGGSCRAADLNFDGHVDIVRHRDSAGLLIREEADTDFDGRLDVMADYGGTGNLLREAFDANWDGAVDLWVVFSPPCGFLDARPSTCIRECTVPWCRPRRLPDTEEETFVPPPEPGGAPAEIVTLFRDADGDGLWDIAEVLRGSSPLCVGFNNSVFGDTPDNVRPEMIETYKPAIPGARQPDLDYVRQDYLDLAGDPIVRCEDDLGTLIPCPSPCTP